MSIHVSYIYLRCIRVSRSRFSVRIEMTELSRPVILGYIQTIHTNKNPQQMESTCPPFLNLLIHRRRAMNYAITTLMPL